MKLFLLVALATIAAASSVFRPGEEYIYHYKGQVLSGIPKASRQYAGLFIDTLVVLQFQQNQRVVMKLEKIKLYKINNKISTEPTESLNEGDLTQLTGEQAMVLGQYLVKPLNFRYDEGEVRHIETESEDKYWSINIKKGILSLFQVTLKERSTNFDPYLESSRPSSRSSRPSMSSSFLKAVKKNSVYTVTETDVTGICETKYAVISDKIHITPSSSQMHVTAVRDFDNCQTTPFYIQGLFQGVYINSEEQDILDPLVETTYIITGDRTNFLIKEAKLVGKYSFRIHGLDGGSMSTFLLQTLKLKDTQPISRPIMVNSPSIEKHGLLMVIPKAALIPEKKSMDEVPSFRQNSGWLRDSKRPVNRYLFEEEEEMNSYNEVDVLPIIDHKLSEMLKCLYNPSEMKHCSEKLYQVSRIMRELKKTQLKSIVTKYIEEERSTSEELTYRKSEVILDLLPTLTNPESGKVILELIREKRVSELRGSLMVTAMSLVVKPTPSLIKSYLELFKETPKEHHTKVSPQTLLRRALLLGVGTLTHTLINDMRSRGKPVPEVVSFIQTISEELKRMLEESRSEPDKVLILSAMGNMGSSETIPALRSVVEDTRLSVETRSVAIHALRRLAKQYKMTITPILMSIYLDTKENKDLRMTAVSVVLNSNPGFTTLQLIGHSLRHEPSHQIKTFVYTNLVNWAVNTKHEPEHKELVQNAKLVVKSIKPVPVGLYDTFTVKVSKFLEDYDLGGSVELSKFKSLTSGLASGFNLKLAGTVLGKHREILETKVFGRPFETLLRKLAGPHGLLTEILKNKVTLNELINIVSRMDMRELNTKAIEIFEMFTRTLNGLSEEERPYLYVSLSVLRHELQYLFLNQDKVHDLTKKGIELITEWYVKLTRGIKVDVIKSISLTNSLTIASPVGIPLTVNVSTSGLFKVNGIVKLNNPTSLPKMMLEVDLKPSLDVSRYVSVGANMRWITSGVYLETIVQSDLPSKFSVHLHGPEHMVTLKHYNPTQTLRVLHAKTTPHTFVTFIPTRPEKLPYTFEAHKIVNDRIIKSFDFNHVERCSVSGLEFVTEGTYSVCGPQWCPDIPLFGKQSITILVKPTSNVEYVHLKVKSLKSNIEWEGVPHNVPIHELFSEEDSEYETESYERPPSRNMVTPGEFDNIKTDVMFNREPIRRQILVTYGSSNNQSPKIKGLFTWLMGRQYLKHQFNTQIIRVSHTNTPIWKINVNNVINPLELTEPESTPGDYLIKTHLTWNIGGEERDIKIKIMPGSEFDFSQELKEHKIFTALSLPQAKLQKLKFTAEAEFSHMGKNTLKAITVSHDTLRYFLWDYLTTSVPTSPQHKKVIVAVELLPWWEQMNIIVKTPMRNSYIADVPLYLNPLFPTDEKIKMHDVPKWVFFNRTEVERPWTSLYDTKYDELETLPYGPYPLVGGECVLTKNYHKTFDGAIDNYYMPHALKYNSKGCNLRITETCKPNTPLFKLITSQTSERLVVKLTIPEYEVELVTPTTGSLYVVLNGERKHVTTSNPIEITGPNGIRVMKLEKLNEKVIEVKLYEFGAKIFVDAESQEYKIKLAPWSTLQGQLCGVCGDYNCDASDDISDIFYPTTEKFRQYIKRNVMSTDVCDVERINLDNTEEFSDETMTEKHITIRRYDYGTPMICRSEKKVPQCTHGYRPERTRSVKTCFTCTPEEGSDSSLAPRTYYPVPSWDEDRSVDCTDFYQRVEVPTRCVPKY